ncbi:uncharacterized protein LOC121410545 [Lytechinus variegatus]|uniref:uncharacterized protein LOC121410545 n=1 Tax=Lytechinus variegatus TaxID=7654 RepID=UPI001BB2B72D|nr:uncharacterized protein LOC121410545 [Lytechinus variegatus]XP_041458651.1 uncharacterized protein LOC121410545 [Lytechinus variegatus]
MERGLSQLHVLAVILYLGCLASRSLQDVLTCTASMESDLLSEGDFQDVRIVDGYRSLTQDLIFVGSNQKLTVIDRVTNETEEIGVCYSTAAHSCFKAGTNEEECDNYIRSVTVLKGDCSSYNCTVLVCGTNAMIPRCGKCNLTGSVVRLVNLLLFYL